MGQGLHLFTRVQHVAELILHARKQAEFVEQVAGLENGEVATGLVLGQVGDGLEQRERHILADDGRGLQQALGLRRQAIDARGQDRVDRRRELDALERLHQPIRAVLSGQDVRFDQGPDALLEEERIALRPTGQPGLQPL